MKYTFVITGNQEDRAGNPIPYHRTTQGSFWNKTSKRYNAWKQFVCSEYWLQTVKKLSNEKPYGKEVKGRIEVKISFRGENHADPDNIVKGILDALFENDKHIDVVTSHTCKNSHGSVEVSIHCG
jgi:Holliday junction resolvase RusA-like endonuclease